MIAKQGAADNMIRKITILDLDTVLVEDIKNDYKCAVETDLEAEAKNSKYYTGDVKQTIMALYDIDDEFEYEDFIDTLTDAKVQENFSGQIDW